MTKIKKILEIVCHNCGKILADEVSHLLRWQPILCDHDG